MEIAPATRAIVIEAKNPSLSFCASVDDGLSQIPRSLPTRFLYDLAGSELFERITDLPEYYLTRCETEIFARYADEMVAASRPTAMIEFGSGSSRKTRSLIEAGLGQGVLESYLPIDISADFAREAAHRLSTAYPGLNVTTVTAEYFDAADELPDSEGNRLILFLGSNIGNFTPTEAADFLGRIARDMRSGDCLLIGLDLVKDPAIIEAAYNDSNGITAEFNLNLLRRINRELDADFDLSGFAHEAPFLAESQRIEMRLRSLRRQTASIEAVGRSFEFAEGETIHTEWSQKFTREGFERLAATVGLRLDRWWTDDQGWFADALLRTS